MNKNKKAICPYIMINNNPISTIEGEYYAPLRCVPGISMFYHISNYGNIWDEVIGSIIDYGYDIFGHVIVVLETCNGPVIERVDKLMLMTFKPCPNMDKLYVKHRIDTRTSFIDFKDEEDSIYWSKEKPFESVYITHKHKDGSEITLEQAINICLLIQAGYNGREIHDILGVKSSIADNIKSRRSWHDVTLMYHW